MRHQVERPRQDVRPTFWERGREDRQGEENTQKEIDTHGMHTHGRGEQRQTET